MFQKNVSRRFLGLFRALSGAEFALRLWPLLLEFLPVGFSEMEPSTCCSHEVSSVSPVVLCQVAEMVRMETRAVSREFSDSKARAFALTQKMLVITCFMQFHADLGGSFAQVDGPWLASNALRW